MSFGNGQSLSRRLTPSTAALTAFEAASRHGSFTMAASELSLTQGAISRQIGQLEGQLGTRLFVREKRRVRLTPVGEVYAMQVRRILGELQDATVAVSTDGADDVLSLATLPTFGTRWLMPKISRFIQKHPTVTINFSSRLRPFDLEKEQVDLAVLYCGPAWSGMQLDLIAREEMVVCCNPDSLGRVLDKPKDLLAFPLLELATRPEAWPGWLGEVGLSPSSAKRMRVEQVSSIIRGAIDGLGVALLPRFLISSELESGALITPFEITFNDEKAYFLVCPETKANKRSVKKFRSWIQSEVIRSVHGK